MKDILKITLLALTTLLFVSCNCDFYGSHDLGNNFMIFEGDKLEDRVIIFCPPKKEEKCCTGGFYVIPTYENHYNDEGSYAEYIDKAESNEHWIIAKSILKKNKTAQFWIINKDFDINDKYMDTPLSKDKGEDFMEFINSQITGPLDSLSFKKKVKELKVNLNFN